MAKGLFFPVRVFTPIFSLKRSIIVWCSKMLIQTIAGYLIYWNFVSQTVFGERDCFQPIKWQEIGKQSLCSENSKIVSLSKETFFEFPAIWLVENSLFPWDFFKMHKEPKSQIIRNRPITYFRASLIFMSQSLQRTPKSVALLLWVKSKQTLKPTKAWRRS